MGNMALRRQDVIRPKAGARLRACYGPFGGAISSPPINTLKNLCFASPVVNRRLPMLSPEGRAMWSGKPRLPPWDDARFRTNPVITRA
jgi:hypothetical protein